MPALLEPAASAAPVAVVVPAGTTEPVPTGRFSFDDLAAACEETSELSPSILHLRQALSALSAEWEPMLAVLPRATQLLGVHLACEAGHGSLRLVGITEHRLFMMDVDFQEEPAPNDADWAPVVILRSTCTTRFRPRELRIVIAADAGTATTAGMNRDTLVITAPPGRSSHIAEALHRANWQ